MLAFNSSYTEASACAEHNRGLHRLASTESFRRTKSAGCRSAASTVLVASCFHYKHICHAQCIVICLCTTPHKLTIVTDSCPASCLRAVCLFQAFTHEASLLHGVRQHSKHLAHAGRDAPFFWERCGAEIRSTCKHMIIGFQTLTAHES